ncbi:MAG: ABC transporter permease [Clostridiales bacterium]|jgi:ABC-2 type transport system permease protein|nr:ABC transporter permease [Clostridiales bacterium]
MFNATLFKSGIKGGIKTLALFCAVLTMYYLIIVQMFDPALGKMVQELAAAMPELMAIFGMNLNSATLTGFLASYLYGFIIIMFPMIFSILSVNRLIVRHVDGGSLVFLVAAPIKRRDVAFTQMTVILSGLLALTLYVSVLGIVASEISFPGELETGKFILLNLGALALHMFIAGICFLSACIFNETKYSVGIGAGIPVLGFIIQMLSNSGEKLEGFKYATFFSLFSTDGLIAMRPNAVWGMVALFFCAIALFISAIAVFTKKDLHI